MTTMQRKLTPAATHILHETEVVRQPAARKALAALRLAYGLVFLWAFFDKLLSLGYATGRDAETGAVDRFGDAAWINGGSPTKGFMDYGVAETNWFQGFFNALGGTPFADWLFMVGLLGIGAALTFGFGMRIAAATGALLYTMMWIASFPLENNPIVDDHMLGAISVVVLGLTLAGDTWGVGKAWASRQLVRQYPFLR